VEPAAASTLSDNADGLSLGAGAAAGAGPHELYQLAGDNIPFWANMVKYARFSISIMGKAVLPTNATSVGQTHTGTWRR